MKVILSFLTVFSLFHYAQSQTTYDQEMEALAYKTVQKIKTKEARTVAVWFFHDTKGKKTELGDYIGRDFSIYFTNASNGFNVVDRDHIEQISNEHKWNEEGFIDSQTAKDVGKILAADAIVTGTVDVGLHTLRIRIKVINTTTGVQVSANIGNISIDENIKVILEDTNFNKPIKKGSNRVNRDESENDQRTTNKKCEKLGTGDYCFTNKTNKYYLIDVNGIDNKRSRSVTAKPNQDACFFDLPEGTYKYSMYKNNLRTTTGPNETGSFRIEKCKSITNRILN